jgi:hypothetical protein
MTPSDLTKRARAAVRDLLDLPLETVARCARDGDGWIVEVEVTETKGKLPDNDIIARYQLKFDGDGEISAYERIQRSARSVG